MDKSTKKNLKKQGIKLVKDFFQTKSIIFREQPSKEKKTHHLQDLLVNLQGKTEKCIIKDRSSLAPNIQQVLKEGLYIETKELFKLKMIDCKIIINTFITPTTKFFIILNTDLSKQTKTILDLPTTTFFNNNEIISKDVTILDTTGAILVELKQGNFSCKKLLKGND